jgi:hypothetical protein
MKIPAEDSDTVFPEFKDERIKLHFRNEQGRRMVLNAASNLYLGNVINILKLKGLIGYLEGDEIYYITNAERRIVDSSWLNSTRDSLVQKRRMF